MANSSKDAKKLLLQVAICIVIFIIYEGLLYSSIDFDGSHLMRIVNYAPNPNAKQSASTVFLEKRATTNPSVGVTSYPKLTALETKATLPASQTIKVVLFWTPFWGSPDIFAMLGVNLFSGCPVSNCIPSLRHADINKSSAVLFHPADFNLGFLPPPPRNPNQHFVFYYLESVGSMDLVPTYPNWHVLNNFFNLTMTYRRDSDIFFRNYFNSYQPHEYQPGNRSKNILWMVSHCNTFSRRELYAKELSKYTEVDIFGKCGKRQVCRNAQDCPVNFPKAYRFYLAFENSICKDYVTEKLIFALNNDLIPIVFGGSNYSDFLPRGSFINVEDYRSPAALAAFIKVVLSNESLYETFHSWKTKSWNFPDVPTKDRSSWCQLCEILNQPTGKGPRKVYPDISKWWFGDQCRGSAVISNIAVQAGT